MSELKVKGILKKKMEVQSGTSKAGTQWSKQDFLIETQDQFPKIICFTLFGDKMDLLQYHKEGTEIIVHFNLESREYNGKYFHNVNAWRIVKAEIQEAEEVPTTEETPMPGGDDLPF